MPASVPLPESTSTYSYSEPGPDIRSVLSFLRRRRGAIALGFVSVFGAVAAFTFLFPKTYESSALILVERRGPSMESPALDVLDRLGRGSQIETEIQLVESRRVLERVVDDLDLHVFAETSAGKKKRPSKIFSSFDASPDARVGAYRIRAVDGGKFAVSEWGSDSLITTVGSPFSFLGLTGRMSDTLSATGIKVDVTQFSRVVKRTQDRIEAKRLGRDADLVEVMCRGPTAEQAHTLCGGVLASYMRLRTDLQRAEATATATFSREQAQRLGEQLAAAEAQTRS